MGPQALKTPVTAVLSSVMNTSNGRSLERSLSKPPSVNSTVKRSSHASAQASKTPTHVHSAGTHHVQTPSVQSSVNPSVKRSSHAQSFETPTHVRSAKTPRVQSVKTPPVQSENFQDTIDVDQSDPSHDLHDAEPVSTVKKSSRVQSQDMDSRGRSRHRSPPANARRSSSSYYRSRSRSTSEARKHIRSAPFYNDIIPSGRPAIKDYSPVVRRQLLETAYIYENWILSDDGFPDKESQYAWARKAWSLAGTDSQEQYKLSERMLKLVSFNIQIYLVIRS